MSMLVLVPLTLSGLTILAAMLAYWKTMRDIETFNKYIGGNDESNS